MQKTNEIQVKILIHLLFNPGSRFKEMNVDKLGTDSFSYHVSVLLDLGLIKKEGNQYFLTKEGKITASKIDTEKNEFERQPKVSVIVLPHKKIDGVEKFAIHQRTKEPYFGYWGFITGKVKWGETLEDASERELNEELGISGKHKFCFGIHEMVYEVGTEKLLEDKFFHAMEVTNLKNELKERTKEGINRWMTVDEFFTTSPKYHNEEDFMTWFLNKDFGFKEEKYFIEKF